MGQALGKVPIAWRGKSLLDELIKPVERALAVGLGSAEQCKLLTPPLIRLVALLQKRRQQLGKTLGCQYSLLERGENNPIQLLHPDGTARAGSLAPRGSP
ncbi:hypothetical protein [Sphingomonas daechungensis]|uniref:hypothetical protein n=1 Tax=Sphingomonas daechungensis TaxID=1176646 RepID=UPI0031ED572E